MHSNNHHTIRITGYKPEYASYFNRLNKAWLEEFFKVEPIDSYVLEHPEEAILDKGGKILFALYEDKVIGTVALKYVAPGVVELTKMAVDKAYQGIGGGKLLCHAAIAEAKNINAVKVILYSNTKLANAINIYRSMGFIELPVEESVYERSNIKMELQLAEKLEKTEIELLIESYGKAADKIDACLKNIPKEIWDWQPPYNKWTIRQNIIHLADSEANSYVRCRRFVAEPGSVILGYNQDKWATRLDYTKQNTDDALALFRLLRKTSYDLIKRLPFSTWENTVEHTENGSMKMWQWLRTYENHTHVLQMQRVYEEWKKEILH
jgi:ribosomal protein S18 acetylase RimI-like enzyme